MLPANIVTKGECNVTFPVEGHEDGMGYLSTACTASEKGLILIQEWWGLNVNMCKVCDEFGEKGFVTMAPDIYRGKCASDREEAGHLMQGLDFKGAVADIIACAVFLKSKGCKKVGIAGFCMGGALTIASICNSIEFDAAGVFYGIPDLNTVALSNIKCPVSLNFGLEDPMKGFSDADSAKDLSVKMGELGIQVELNLYEAGHAFMNRDSDKFNQTANDEATSKLLEFLGKHL